MAKRPADPPADPIDLTGEGVREVRTELDRIIYFSDAVFAIAITLLALDIHFPTYAAEPSDAVLWYAIAALLPRFGTYALSFVVVGVFWLSHHRSFRAIKRYDLRLIWLNLSQLLFIAFLPVSSSLLGDYPLHQPALILYSLNVIAAGTLQYMTWNHATKNHHLVDASLDERLIRYVRLNSVISIAAFGLTIVISFISVQAALVIPILMLAIYIPFAPMLQTWGMKLMTRPPARAK